jgi:hypothetical protein
MLMSPIPKTASHKTSAHRHKILVLGVYLVDKPSHVRSIVDNIARTARYMVVQRWVALGGTPKDPSLIQVTWKRRIKRCPKFSLINQLLDEESLNEYEYIVVIDDDIRLPERFLDTFLDLQSVLGFSLAQPARTTNSYIDHPLVQQVKGIVARQTLFVEIGPVTSFHRSIFDLVIPFDLTSPMGWGYENIWAYRLYHRGCRMGIIDSCPVDHSLRPTARYYKWKEAAAGADRILHSQKHFSLARCYKTLRIFRDTSGRQ